MNGSFVAVNVQRLREERAWTQEHLAHIASISARTLQRVERGAPASFETLQSLASALDTDVGALRAEPVGDEATRKALEELTKYEVVRLQVVERGSELGRLLGNSHGLVFDNDQLEHESDEDAVAEFKQLMVDWMDIWSDLAPVQQRSAEKSLDAALVELRTRGLVVAGNTHQTQLILTGQKPLPWEWTCLVVSRASEPRVFAVWDRTRALV